MFRWRTLSQLCANCHRVTANLLAAWLLLKVFLFRPESTLYTVFFFFSFPLSIQNCFYSSVQATEHQYL
ncbi:hypothetical protein MHYP_G00266610 [Metynnis hypsauchen]